MTVRTRRCRKSGSSAAASRDGIRACSTLAGWTPLLLLGIAASAAAAPGGNKGGGDQPSATLDFSADQPSYQIGDVATLRWRSTGTRFCSASGDWNGKLASEGSYRTAPLDGPKSYDLACKAAAGDVSETLTLAVAEPGSGSGGAGNTGSEPVTPALALTASQTLVASGATATLSWSADNASGCTASGGWAGARGTSGTERVGPIYGSTAFTLSCDGSGVSVVETVRVDVLGQVTLRWQPPANNVDGSALNDLAGFDVYYGSTSGAYDQTVHITDPAATSHTLTLPSGSYFVAMTATDRDGNESGYSNEIQRAVP